MHILFITSNLFLPKSPSILGENRKSGTLEAKTKIAIGDGYFIPDGIMLTEKDGKETIHLIEMYCDPSSTRVLEQLQKHVLAIAEGTPAKKFGIQANPFVLSAFENDGVKSRVIEKLIANKSFEPFAHLFFFASLEDIKTDISIAWKTINNNPLTIT